MKDLKKDFPIFENNDGLVYFDNAATTQKPYYVIEGVSNYLKNYYANIHRGIYHLSEHSEELYFESKKKIAEKIGGKKSEIVYTYNSTYAFNILAQSLYHSGYITKGDKILLTIAEHHSNMVPWILLQNNYGIELDYVETDENGDIDMEDFDNKYDSNVKIVASTHVSNVTGTIYDLKSISNKLRDDTIFVVDGSQSVPSFNVDVNDLGIDFLGFTAHKMLGYQGLGILWGKKDLFKKLTPTLGGGGCILDVDKTSVEFLEPPEGFEPGTPNVTGAISLLKSIEYIESIGDFDFIYQREKALSDYFIERAEEFSDYFEIVGKKNSNNRLPLFSFIMKNNFSPVRFGEFLSMNNICIRCGGHCSHPYINKLGYGGTCRVSLYFYNDYKDIDKFFDTLKKFIS